MTDAKSELEELKALQKQSRVMQKKREATVQVTTDSPKKVKRKASLKNPEVEEVSAPPGETAETVEDLKGQIENIMSELEEAAKEHPTLALLAAFGIGVFVGQLLSRR